MNNGNNNGTPFVESYRPTKIEDIVLDPLNRKILNNIVTTSYFPNIILYGPPGTGKTSSIMALINAYQQNTNQVNKGLIIHLNASDERGIDIIRNQISQFVNSKTLFSKGMKFVILDEVDYMTKNAQQALRYLLQSYSTTVRFCLICNYISRIDEGLQNEFMRMRFNQLPEDDIVQFLSNICYKEGLNISKESLQMIQKLYNSDIRSMINFLQSNQNNYKNINIIDRKIWETLYNKFEISQSNEDLNNYIELISVRFNIDKKNIIKDFLNYIIRNKSEILNKDFLNLIENIMHNQDCNNSCFINYSLLRLSSFIPKK
jgi:DNA polymerase III delta prime subunit